MIARIVDRIGRMLTDRHAESFGPFSADDTAVIVLSCQADVFADDGRWSTLCTIGPSAKQLARFLDHSRQNGWMVCHSPMSWSEESLASAVGRTLHIRNLARHGLLRHGESGAGVTDELVAASDHVSPERHGLNAFFGTGLREYLQSNNRRRLIVIGGVANADVDSTSRAAVEYDFDVTIIGDLVSAYDEINWANTLEVTLPRIVQRIVTSDEMLRSLGPGLAGH